jgi:hypothetical protein
MTDIRTKTTLIVERDGDYLQGLSIYLRWSQSPYDAWNTRNIEAAQLVADKVGGTLMLFNPVVRQLRKYNGKGVTA